MKKTITIILSLILTSCGSLNEAGKVLRNEKIKTNDEFLVKKKAPLVLPPNYSEIPEPGSIKKKNINEEEKIKSILGAPKSETANKESELSTEDSILKKIKK